MSDVIKDRFTAAQQAVIQAQRELAFAAATKKRNDKFRALSLPKQRMAIARDVLSQLALGRFISGVVYDHRTLTMDVQLVRQGEPGPIYRYENVTPLEFTLLITSRSTGKTYNAVINGQKTCTRLTRKAL